MIVLPSVVIDRRNQDALSQELAARRAGYVDGWKPEKKDPGRAIEEIAARYAHAVLQRLNQSPEKNKLAFLDMLGKQLSPARAARAPIVFQLMDGATGGQAPAGTSVAAPPPPGSSQQMVFETETATGITPGKLAQVFSLWPGRDTYIDHSADLLAGKALNLFERPALTATPHILYLAHSALLNLSGNVDLAVEFQLLDPAAKPLTIAWEYWDGQVWRGFAALDPCGDSRAKAPLDATNGLTASGVITLKADCAKSDKTVVNGISGYWIRGRLTQTLPPDPARPVPDVESIRISNRVSSAFTGRLDVKSEPASAAIFAKAVNSNVRPPLKGKLFNEAQEPLRGATVVVSRAGVEWPAVKPTEDEGEFEIPLDYFLSNEPLQFEVIFGGIRTAARDSVQRITDELSLTLKLSGLSFDKAFNDGTKLDTTKPFYPFGQQPQPGTVFYFSNKEVFAKPGARFRVYLPKTSAPSDKLRDGATVTGIHPVVMWEYWDGRVWSELASLSEPMNLSEPASLRGPASLSEPAASGRFAISEILEFAVPSDLVPVAVNDDTDLWMRARLVSGGYGFFQTVGTTDARFTMIVTQPPILAAAALSYSWQFGPFHPETVLTCNDFRYEDHTYEAIWPGSFFHPYRRIEDVTPTLYLGFDQKPPTAAIGLFFDIVEQPSGDALASLTWEYWDGFAWTHVAVDDQTKELTTPGILSFIAEDDSAPLARFGTSLYWLRGRLKEDGPPTAVTTSGIYPNAVWAKQQRTFTDVDIGKASGQPNEVFRVAQSPIVPQERLEVLELSGPRANVEWRRIALELLGSDNQRIRELERQLGKEALAGDVVDGDVRLRRDKQKRVAEVWIRWYPQPNLFGSAAADRHYVIDRTRGLVFFGDGANGRTLPLDATVRLREFKSGGGSDGNVAARTITQLLGAVSGVQAVFNPRATEGGSDRETLEHFRLRAPASVRHAGRALTVGDYEAMVREASSAITIVKALPNRNPSGRRLPGWLTVLIIPESQEPRPYPTRGLRDKVQAYLAKYAPAGLVASDHLYVTGPVYFSVDVSATIVPLLDSEAGIVDARARVALETFLHPLHGGPQGDGWDFGRGVFLSDLASVLGSVEGLDYAEAIELLVNDEVRGDLVDVPPDQIVVAGEIRIKVKGAHS